MNRTTTASAKTAPAQLGPRVYNGNITPAFKRPSIYTRGVPLQQLFHGIRWNHGLKPRMKMTTAWILPIVIGAYWALYPSSNVVIDRLSGIEAD